MTVKVSVLTPVYNAEPFLAEAIESIFAQTLSDFEFILVDDGSSDGSAEILRDYSNRDKRIRVFTLPRNRGMPYALNYGLQRARAPLIARMDADDISLPERLQKQYDYMQKHSEVAALGSQGVFFVEDSLTRKKKIVSKFSYPSQQKERRMMLRYVCGLIPVCHGTCMYRRDLALQIGGYREFFRHGAEDQDFFQRLWDRHPLDNLPEVLYWYRASSSSTFVENQPAFIAGVVMAMLFALHRQAGRGDPLEAVKRLEHLPQHLGFERSVSCRDLQTSPHWGMISIIEHLQRRTLAPRIRARLYDILAYWFCRRGNFPNSKIDWRRYIFCVAASMLASVSAFPLWVRKLWA